MKKSLNNKKPTVTKRKQLSIVLDKENIPPSITTPTPIKRSSSQLSLNCSSSKKTKIKKTTTTRNKKILTVKSLPQIRNKDEMKTNSKKQEEERSHPNVVSPIITANVDLISRRLKDNLTKATYNMMACLVLSNQPHDHFIYERLFKSSHSLEYKKTLNNNNHQSNMEMLVSGAAAETNTNNNNNNIVSPPSFLKQEEFIGMIPTINQSFDTEQENDFISTWLQHDTGGGNCSEYSSSCIDSYDTFSIITEQELSDLLSQDSFSQT